MSLLLLLPMLLLLLLIWLRLGGRLRLPWLRLWRQALRQQWQQQQAVNVLARGCGIHGTYLRLPATYI